MSTLLYTFASTTNICHGLYNSSLPMGFISVFAFPRAQMDRSDSVVILLKGHHVWCQPKSGEGTGLNLCSVVFDNTGENKLLLHNKYSLTYLAVNCDVVVWNS